MHTLHRAPEQGCPGAGKGEGLRHALRVLDETLHHKRALGKAAETPAEAGVHPQ